LQRWAIDWRFGKATVRASAAMLWECEFLLPSGRTFQPFAHAPWADDPALDPGLPAHLRHLGGEFVCVPFGIGGRPQDLLPEWESGAWKQVNASPHGLSSDAAWNLISADATHVSLRLAYPDDDDIEFLTRRIAVVPDAPALDLELAIHVRRPTRQPLGLHPILRLPEAPAELVIESAFEFGMTYPAMVPPGISRVAPGRRFTRLESVPGMDGGTIDYARLPKDTPTEEMLMLCGIRAPVTVHYPGERAAFRLSWDTKLLPSCLLWPSDCSVAEPPWNRRFRGLGLEPIAALFDAGRDLTLERNPINAAGIATSVAIVPGQPLVIRYRIEALEANAFSAVPRIADLSA
jgi:hypothetical protein